jgi:ketosteroid isomerase-like protein
MRRYRFQGRERSSETAADGPQGRSRRLRFGEKPGVCEEDGRSRTQKGLAQSDRRRLAKLDAGAACAILPSLCAVSKQNVEIVQELVAASQRGDWEAALEKYDPAVELDMRFIPGGDLSIGREAVRSFFTNWFGTWDRLEIEPERFIDMGENVVVVLRIAGVGKGSGIETSMRSADVMTVHDGKVVRHVGYPKAETALVGLGLID